MTKPMRPTVRLKRKSLKIFAAAQHQATVFVRPFKQALAGITRADDANAST